MNLGRFIWHRWDEVCVGLSDLGLGGGGTRDGSVPRTIAEVRALLSCRPFALCGERPVAQVLDVWGVRRVIGFCETKYSEPERRPEEPSERPIEEEDERAKSEEERKKLEENVKEEQKASKGRPKRKTRTAPRRTAPRRAAKPRTSTRAVPS
jgi:hypothetical protein